MLRFGRENALSSALPSYIGGVLEGSLSLPLAALYSPRDRETVPPDQVF